jgi:two-component system OmpR family response regulator
VSHPTILVVDDNPQIISLLQKLLARINATVLIAASGAEALAALPARPDLVLLDLQLPDMSGYEVYRRIKAGRDIPVIFTTGAELEEVVGGIRLRPADYVVPKPFDVRELLRLIQLSLAVA